MNVLVNLSTLKIGGGQNVAMNFLLGLNALKFEDVKFFFVVAKDSAPHRFLQSIGAKNYYVAPANPIARIAFELFGGSKIIRQNSIEIVYTYFGHAAFPKHVPQVSGSADSNIYFPEIDFWAHYTGFARLKRWFVDQYRLWGVKRASAVIFENEAMRQRGEKLLGLKETRYIKPSLTLASSATEFLMPNITAAPKGLFLCGWQLNKNVMVIPHLAAELKRREIAFQFLLTAPIDNSGEHQIFSRMVEALGVQDMVNVVGQVAKEQLASLYSQIDFVFLLSKLESFSNNIIEAWHFNRPLLIASEEWSRSICKNAAFYVDRNNVSSVVDGIEVLLRDQGVRNSLVENGSRALTTYPRIEERIAAEIDYLKYVAQLR